MPVLVYAMQTPDAQGDKWAVVQGPAWITAGPLRAQVHLGAHQLS
jgi:hypothetical protein